MFGRLKLTLSKLPQDFLTLKTFETSMRKLNNEWNYESSHLGYRMIIGNG